MNSDLTRRREGAKNEEELASIIVDTALEVHSELGPGLLESVYEIVLAEALIERGLGVERQVDVPITYRGKVFLAGFRADLLIDGKICIEVKSIETLAPIHGKQVLTYLRLLDYRLGLLINFGAPLLKDGLKRIVNGLDSSKYSSRLRAFAVSRETPHP